MCVCVLGYKPQCCYCAKWVSLSEAVRHRRSQKWVKKGSEEGKMRLVGRLPAWPPDSLTFYRTERGPQQGRDIKTTVCWAQPFFFVWGGGVGGWKCHLNVWAYKWIYSVSVCTCSHLNHSQTGPRWEPAWSSWPVCVCVCVCVGGGGS